MSTTVSELALLLARDETQKMLEPKGYWPSSSDQTVSFAGMEFTQEDLTEMVFSKHKDLFLTEATTLLSTRPLIHKPRIGEAELPQSSNTNKEQE